ncbi:MAG: 2Fe-2S iron-sulfur cluster-binding protein [Campylobacterota bacterium]|nr:2Fe-2S iron-sulfur cluster-binding protein [Campylobacterota bacterium]
MQIKCSINHKEYVLDVEPTSRAIDIIRGLKITSIKEGCGEGECGACSIFFNGKLINSCLLLAVQMQDSKILTLEGLYEETEIVRKNFEKTGAIQCGFCTSGFILRSYDYIKNNGVKDEAILKDALDGNLCRCTGYQKIVDAVIKSMK